MRETDLTVLRSYFGGPASRYPTLCDMCGSEEYSLETFGLMMVGHYVVMDCPLHSDPKELDFHCCTSGYIAWALLVVKQMFSRLEALSGETSNRDLARIRWCKTLINSEEQSGKFYDKQWMRRLNALVMKVISLMEIGVRLRSSLSWV